MNAPTNSVEDSKKKEDTQVSPAAAEHQQQQEDDIVTGTAPVVNNTHSSNSSNRTDEDLLHRAIEDAGRWAYGIVLIELWVLNDDKTQLMRPPGGVWLDPVFYNSTSQHQAQTDQNEQQQQHDRPLHHIEHDDHHEHQQHPDTTGTTASTNPADILSELFDMHNPAYQEPAFVSPGVGLPGVLWSEVDRASRTTSVSGTMVWRDMAGLAQDPDHATNVRLNQLVQAGLGWAGAVAFERMQQQGIVIYMARHATDLQRLQASSNENYLRAAADWMGCTYALRGPRQAAVMERRQELRQAIQRAKNRLLSMKQMGINLSTLVLDHSAKEDEELYHHNWCSWDALWKFFVHHIPKKMTSLYHKCWGGQVPGPPAFSWEQTLWSTMGAFLTIIMLVKLNDHVTAEYGTAHLIFLPPLASLVVQLYGLTAAPATQPLNIMLGQALSMTIGICLKYNHHVGSNGYPLYLQQSLAVALAAAVMVKVGVTHPPASAYCVVFVSTLQHLSWGNMAFIMVADVITIGMATLVNNLNEKRQYPTAWGFRQVHDMLFRNLVAKAVAGQWASWKRIWCRRSQTATTGNSYNDDIATYKQSID